MEQDYYKNGRNNIENNKKKIVIVPGTGAYGNHDTDRLYSGTGIRPITTE